MGTRVDNKVAAGGNFLGDGIFLNLNYGGGYTTACVWKNSINCTSNKVNFFPSSSFLPGI